MRRLQKRRRLPFVFCGLATALGSFMVGSQDVQAQSATAAPPPAALPPSVTITPSYTQTVGIDNNPLLLPHGAKTLYGTTMSPEAVIATDTASSHLDLDSRVDVSEFNLPHYGSQDYHGTFHASHEAELVTLKMLAVLDYDTTRTSEAAAAATEVAGIRRTHTRLAPDVYITLSAADSFVLRTSYDQSLYANTQFYTDFRSIGFNPTLYHDFGGGNSGIFLIHADSFSTLNGPHSTGTNVGPGLGWRGQITTALKFEGYAGYHRVRSHQAGGPVQARNSGFYKLNLSYATLQDTASLLSSRDVSLTSQGVVGTQTSVTAQLMHQFLPEFSGTTAISYITESYNIFAPGLLDSYLVVSGQLQYNITRALAVSSTYQYRRQVQTSTIPLPGVSNAILLNVTFSPDSIGLTR